MSLTKRVSRSLALSAVALLLATASGCTSVVQYQPRTMDVVSAKQLVEKLTMTQHPAWKPDYIEFSDTYMVWGFGSVTTQSGSGAVIGSAVFTSGQATTRNSGSRLYYSDVRDVQLLSWRRKGKQWYVVTSVNARGEQMHLLRTRYIDDGKQYVDALRTVLHAYGN